MKYFEVMKQAMDALENITDYDGLANARVALRTAIAEAEKQEPVAWRWKWGNSGWQLEDKRPHNADSTDATVEPLYNAPPAALVQEPVAWVNLDQYGNLHESSSPTVPPDTFPVYRHPPAAHPCRSPYCECAVGKCTHPGFYDARQEPVACLHPANASCVTTDPTAYARGIPLYTTPPTASVQDQVPEGVTAAIRHEGLTLVKDLRGYRLMRLGKIEAQTATTEAPPAARPAAPTLNECRYPDCKCPTETPCLKGLTATLPAAPVQEPVAWVPIEQPYMGGQTIDILMGDGSILCNVLPQFDGDLWWEGSGTGEKFIDPKYANVTHWRVHSDTTPPAAPADAGDTLFRQFLSEAEKAGVTHLAPPAAPVQEPAAEIVGANAHGREVQTVAVSKVLPKGTKLYTTPPAAQRQWVGLTDDERLEVAEIDGADEWFWKVCKAIEAKLKEKNT